MIQIGLSSYLTGLTNMASSCSKEIGPSYIEADCFDSKDFVKEFARYYKIPSKKLSFELVDKSLKDVFEEWLGKSNPKIIEGLMYHIESTLGKPLKVYEGGDGKMTELLSGCNGGITRFYSVEEIYFVKFKHYMTCFMMGNNE